MRYIWVLLNITRDRAPTGFPRLSHFPLSPFQLPPSTLPHPLFISLFTRPGLISFLSFFHPGIDTTVITPYWFTAFLRAFRLFHRPPPLSVPLCPKAYVPRHRFLFFAQFLARGLTAPNRGAQSPCVSGPRLKIDREKEQRVSHPTFSSSTLLCLVSELWGVLRPFATVPFSTEKFH